MPKKSKEEGLTGAIKMPSPVLGCDQEIKSEMNLKKALSLRGDDQSQGCSL